MKINSSWYTASRLSLSVGLIGGSIGLFLGIAAGFQPLLLCLAILALTLFACFFTYFEQTVIGLLILRSSLDIFSDWQVPAAFAIGLDALTILYVILMLLLGRQIITDKFFWFFATWVAIQGLWVIFIPLGGLGLNASYLLVGIREWVRLFSWLMVYLLVMQLKDKVKPERFVGLLMLSLIAPMAISLIQVIVPSGILPDLLVYRPDKDFEVLGEGSRIFGTLGHPNGLAKFLILFIALTWWQLERSLERWFWIILMSILIFFLVTTQALFAIAMFGVFIVVRAVQNISVSRLFGAAIVFALFIALFATSEYGLERLNSIANTPLLNPDIGISQAILMAEGNSFNWRIAHWTYLLQAWQSHQLFGYGLGGTPAIPYFYNDAHSDYVRALVEGGVVGLTTFFIFQAGQLVRLVQLYKKASPTSDLRRFCSILLAIFWSFLVGMTTDNMWGNTVMYFYWWSLLAVAGWDWNQDRPSQS
ncbi:MAG: O-antigen ligase family protein [Cyanobacteria bacterium P01_G01_bin.19]